MAKKTENRSDVQDDAAIEAATVAAAGATRVHPAEAAAVIRAAIASFRAQLLKGKVIDLPGIGKITIQHRINKAPLNQGGPSVPITYAYLSFNAKGSILDELNSRTGPKLSTTSPGAPGATQPTATLPTAPATPPGGPAPSGGAGPGTSPPADGAAETPPPSAEPPAAGPGPQPEPAPAPAPPAPPPAPTPTPPTDPLFPSIPAGQLNAFQTSSGYDKAASNVQSLTSQGWRRSEPEARALTIGRYDAFALTLHSQTVGTKPFYVASRNTYEFTLETWFKYG